MSKNWRGLKTRRLDAALMAKGLITEEQLQAAKDKSMGSKRPLQDELIEMGFITEDQMWETIRSLYPEIAVVDLSKIEISLDAVNLIPYDITQKYSVIPIGFDEKTITVAMSNPLDLLAIDDIHLITKRDVEPVLAKKSQILEAIRTNYNLDDSIYDIYKNIVVDDDLEILSSKKEEEKSVEDLEADGRMAPVIRLVNLMISDAIKMRASDIHLEPKTNEVELRYRIDGLLRKIMAVDRHLLAPLISRIKIISNLDIAERRVPQDGRTKIRLQGKEIDLRVSILPTLLGEKAVIRILDVIGGRSELKNLGFSDEEVKVYLSCLQKPQGMILVTGPTGSGKTSTLYASLNYISDETKNIVTIENPIEYQLDGINQVQINEAAGVTFASSLRSILRQDPNVILVGEIRDLETAEIAFQSSLTGHLVMSTLHTNNAVATISRLVDIGIEPYLIASSLLGIVAQRLVRRICPSCKTEAEPEKFLLQAFNLREGEHKFYRGSGCEKCEFTGYKGRIAVFEILNVTEEIKEMIASGESEKTILDKAKENGMKLLWEAGLEEAIEGITTLEEVVRVTGSQQSDELICPQCNRKINADFQICPYCRTTLTQICSHCKKPVEAEWHICPYCGNETEIALKKVGKVACGDEKKKILVADDNANIREVMKWLFEDYDVIEAEDGRQTLEKAFKENPDLIILDVTMPVMDGIETCRRLRSNLKTGSIPIIMLTVKQGVKDELEGLHAGADDYVRKPFSKDIFKARAKMLLHQGSKARASA